jgi:hypothetical protein
VVCTVAFQMAAGFHKFTNELVPLQTSTPISLLSAFSMGSSSASSIISL